jgi:predicted GNAT family acetyltransferase
VVYRLPSLPETIDIVAEALTLNQSIVAPAEVIRHGPLWIMRDRNSKPGKARLEEVFAYGAPPAEIVRALRDYAPRGRYALAPFVTPEDDAEEIKAVIKASGFRLVRTEPLFVCPLANREPATSPWTIRRVQSAVEARFVCTQIYGRAHRKLRPEDLSAAEPAMRMYWVDVDGKAVAVTRSLRPRPTATWMHDVLTLPEYRRRGIATALMKHVLSEDARLGSEHNVLLASQAGSKLYPLLGYQQPAVLQIYMPLPSR